MVGLFEGTKPRLLILRGVRGEDMPSMLYSTLYPPDLTPSPSRTNNNPNKQQCSFIAGGDVKGVAIHSYPGALCVFRPQRSLLVPIDPDTVRHDVLDAQRTRSICLVDVSAKCELYVYFDECGEEDNATRAQHLRDDGLGAPPLRMRGIGSHADAFRQGAKP